MKEQEIIIKISTENYKRTEAVANLMGRSVENLTEDALESFLYTVKDYLNHIDEHVFPRQIFFD